MDIWIFLCQIINRLVYLFLKIQFLSVGINPVDSPFASQIVNEFLTGDRIKFTIGAQRNNNGISQFLLFIQFFGYVKSVINLTRNLGVNNGVFLLFLKSRSGSEKDRIADDRNSLLRLIGRMRVCRRRRRGFCFRSSRIRCRIVIVLI